MTKPRGDVSRSPKHGYQWSHKRTYVLKKFMKKKRAFSEPSSRIANLSIINQFKLFFLQLQFKYNLNGGSYQEICLDNIIFIETGCCKFDLAILG